MRPVSLSEIAETQVHGEAPSKSTVLRSEGINAVQVILGPEKEILPHPEDYAVLFVVLEGCGRMTTGDGVWDVRPGDVVHLGQGRDEGYRRGYQDAVARHPGVAGLEVEEGDRCQSIVWSRGRGAWSTLRVEGTVMELMRT